MSTVTITWTPEAFMKDLNAHCAAGINAAAAVLSRQMQNNVVERPGGGAFVGALGGESPRMDRGGHKNYLGQIGMESKISKWGQSPSYQFGNMRRSIRVHQAATPSNLVAVAGSRGAGMFARGFDYPAYLEFSRNKNANRPWMRVAVEMARGRMMSAFKTGAALPGYGNNSQAGSTTYAAARSVPSMAGVR